MKTDDKFSGLASISTFSSCQFHATQRIKLLSSVSAILSQNDLSHLSDTKDVYPYDDPSLTFPENRNIILATIEYIKIPKDSSNGFQPCPPHPYPWRHVNISSTICYALFVFL